jgi:hypothetical protein
MTDRDFLKTPRLTTTVAVFLIIFPKQIIIGQYKDMGQCILE